MKVESLIQGSPEWLAYRATHFNASDAPAMMGCSPYKTRAELLREMHTGVAADVDIATQKRFDNGHRAEALARPLAEEFIGQELYPVTGSASVPGVARSLSASFDGLTLEEAEGFEHKALSDAIRAAFDAMDRIAPGAPLPPWEEGSRLPIYHRVQMEQQLLVSGAKRILFMASEWTAGGELVEERHVWYYPDATLRQQIVDGWAQFERDLAAYAVPPAVEPVTATPVESLPAVAVRMDGALVVQSNLPAFGTALRAFVERVPKRPSTDQEFADTEAACKALKRAEEALDAAEANALASLSDVEAMRRMVADFRNLARDTRLASEKMVERRKLEIKEAAVLAARKALDLHIAVVNAEIAPMQLLPVAADFAGAIKGKRSVASMQDALDTTLAAAKIAADNAGRAIRANAATFKAKAEGMEFLFADLGQLVHKAADDFAALVDARITTHKAAEERKAREKAEAEARAAEQRRQAEEARQAEQQRRAEEDRAAAAAFASLEAAKRANAMPAELGQALGNVLASTAADMVIERAMPAPRADEPATLKLGDIGERLGFALRAEFITGTLQITPAATERGLPRFSESQFDRICFALATHVAKVQQKARAALLETA